MSFKCSYCQKEYLTPVERARCEISCSANMKYREEQEKKRKRETEKQNRFSEIQKCVDVLNDKMSEYIRDYGERIYLSNAVKL